MAFNVKGAKEAGYSDKEIQSYLAEKNPDFKFNEAIKAGYSLEDISNHLTGEKKELPNSELAKKLLLRDEELPNEPITIGGTLKHLFGRVGATAVGAAGSALNFGRSALGSLGAETLREQEEPETRPIAPQNEESVLGLPTIHGEMEKLGPGQNALERIIGTAAEFGTSSGPAAPAGAFIGAAYQGAIELGLDPKAALALISAIPLIPKAFQTFSSKIQAGESAGKALASTELAADEIQNISKELSKTEKTPKKSAAIEEKLLGEKETFKSGLTKPAAVEAEHAGKGIITPERQKKAIKELNSEASELFSKSVEKNVPLTKQIKEGHDFNFDEKFKELGTTASKANPTIDVTDVTEFINGSAKEYKGIPKELLHDEAKKVLKEVSIYRNQPQTEMKNLYKLFRINNKKRGRILEQRLLKGSQKEYEKFLTGLNKSIEKSFERTLGSDGVWIKEFKNLNKEYSQVQNAKHTLSQLEGVMNGEITRGKITRIATDTKTQKKLSAYMGKEAAEEIIQIAKDLKKATEAIKSIPAKELSAWDAILPLSAIIPGFQVPGGLAAAKKGLEFGRRGYGYYLTTPARRTSYDKVLKAIEHGDKTAYKEATKTLQ